MEALLVSAGVVALAEIGDKTQLLALVLAARFRAPLPVILGILTATLSNHFAGRGGRHAARGPYQPRDHALAARHLLLRGGGVDVHTGRGAAG